MQNISAPQSPEKPSQDSRNEKSAFQIIGEDALRHKKQIIAAIVVIFFVSVIFFYRDLKALFVIAALIALGALSRIWQRFVPLPIGANLIMLSAVVSGVLYGSFAGAAVGFISLLLSAFIAVDDISTMFPPLFAVSIAGYIAGYVPVSEIALGGIILTVLYDAIISVTYLVFGLFNINTSIFVVTHIVFNYFVFYNVAPALVTTLA